MSNILFLDEEVEFPEIYGIIAPLPAWKMCFIVANAANLQLAHEDTFDFPTTPVQRVKNNQLYTFDKYVWFDAENEVKFLHLIQNKNEFEETTLLNTEQNDLFGGQTQYKKTICLFDEWKNVDYILHAEGLEKEFDPFILKKEKGVRMVLHATADQFKNYDKII